MLRKVFRILYKGFLVFIVLILCFVVYFIFAIYVPEPKIADISPLKQERVLRSENFYTVGNNWLKKSESGLWELYVEGNGFERGAANGHLTKELAEFQEDAFIHQIQVLIPDLNYLKFLKF